MSYAVKSLERALRYQVIPVVKKFAFKNIEWSNGMFTGKGFRGTSQITVVLRLVGAADQPRVYCTKCQQGGMCVHAILLMRLLIDSGIAQEVERLHFAPCAFSVGPEKPQDPRDRWRADLQQLTERLQSCIPPEKTPARFPPGREAVYVIHHSTYGSAREALEIKVATRPARLDPDWRAEQASRETSIYNNFRAGARALGASADPLDQEIATHLTLSERPNPYGTAPTMWRTSTLPGIRRPICCGGWRSLAGCFGMPSTPCTTA
jgi:hypothetical protein